MSGKDAIIDKIRADAKDVMTGISEDANKKGMEIIHNAQNDAKVYSDKQMTESYAERDEIIRRKITVANLEVKKTLLAAKQELLKKAFDEASEAIRSDKKGYEALLIGMMKCAGDGDEITFSARDKSLVSDEWFLSACKKAGKKLIKNKTFGDFSGGILIAGQGSDKNFTLEVELAGVREEYEPQIAKLLFGE